MSISKIEDILPRYQEIANGSKKEFSVDFALLEDRFVSVYVDSEKLVSGYNVSVDGGKITFDSAPAKGKNITIVRAVPISWEDTFNGALNSSSLNSLLIYLTASIQTVKEEVSRAVKTSISDNINGGEVSEFFLKQLTDAKDILDKSENTLALLTTTIQDALISIEAARVGAVEDVEALVDRAENTLNGKADLNKNNTFTGTNTFTKEIIRNVAFSGASAYTLRSIDTNGKGETSLISYYTGGNIYSRVLAKNTTSGKDIYLDIKSNDNGVGSIAIGGSAPSKNVYLNGATKVIVPTAQSDAETTEAVNIAYLNSKLGGYLPLAGGTMTGAMSMGGKSLLGVNNLEFTGDSKTNGGYLDFHYAGSTTDYTSRIIEDASGQLTYVGSERFTATNLTNSAVLATKGWVNNPSAATNVVHRTGNETIAGVKTFTDSLVYKANARGDSYYDTVADRSVAPTSNRFPYRIVAKDKNGKNFGYIEVAQMTTQRVYARLRAMNQKADGTEVAANLDVNAMPDGTINATCPTPASNANGNEIVTANWVNSKFLPKAGGTMSGNISFSQDKAYIQSKGSSGQVILGQGGSTTNGAGLWLYGNDSEGGGIARIQVYDKTTQTHKALDVRPDGRLTWQGKDIATTDSYIPDYTAAVTFTHTTEHTAEFDGLLYVFGYEGYNKKYVTINGVKIPYIQHSSSGYSSSSVSLPVKKGDKFSAENTSSGVEIYLFPFR